PELVGVVARRERVEHRYLAARLDAGGRDDLRPAHLRSPVGVADTPDPETGNDLSDLVQHGRHATPSQPGSGRTSRPSSTSRRTRSSSHRHVHENQRFGSRSGQTTAARTPATTRSSRPPRDDGSGYRWSQRTSSVTQSPSTGKKRETTAQQRSSGERIAFS